MALLFAQSSLGTGQSWVGALTTPSGYIAMGAAPPASGAIRIDAASYATVALSSTHTTANFQVIVAAASGNTKVGTTSNHNWRLIQNNEDKWGIQGSAGISELSSSQVTARILSGATNGLAIRNSGNTRDNAIITEAGTYFQIYDGTNAARITNEAGVLGELPIGVSLSQTTGSGAATGVFLRSGTSSVGGKTGLSYYDATYGNYRSAVEAPNAAALGTLALMKSGGNIQSGPTAQSNAAIMLSNGVTALSSAAVGTYFYQTLAAAANSDVLRAVRVDPRFTPGAFTGLTARGLEITAFSVAGFTTPANPTMLYIATLTGTGASVATALEIAPPTGATANYLIAHTTPATFNVASDGSITAAGTHACAASIIAGATTAITAGGSLYGHRISSTVNFGMFGGSGVPTITAAKGSLYLRSDGSGVNDRMYVNTNGGTTWTAVVTVA